MALSSRFGWDDFASIAVLFLSAKALKSCRMYTYRHNHAIDNAGKQFFADLTQKSPAEAGLEARCRRTFRAVQRGKLADLQWKSYLYYRGSLDDAISEEGITRRMAPTRAATELNCSVVA